MKARGASTDGRRVSSSASLVSEPMTMGLSAVAEAWAVAGGLSAPRPPAVVGAPGSSVAGERPCRGDVACSVAAGEIGADLSSAGGLPGEGCSPAGGWPGDGGTAAPAAAPMRPGTPAGAGADETLAAGGAVVAADMPPGAGAVSDPDVTSRTVGTVDAGAKGVVPAVAPAALEVDAAAAGTPAEAGNALDAGATVAAGICIRALTGAAGDALATTGSKGTATAGVALSAAVAGVVAGVAGAAGPALVATGSKGIAAGAG